jgi:hypothetical protein
MNARDYRLHTEGREAAAGGDGLSDSPYGGRDGDLWRGGVRSWLDEHGDEHDQDSTPEASPPRRSFSDFWLRTAGPVPGTKSTKVRK